MTTYDATGTRPQASVVMRNVAVGDRHASRSTTWNVEIDREWLRNVFVRVGYQGNVASVSSGGFSNEVGRTLRFK